LIRGLIALWSESILHMTSVFFPFVKMCVISQNIVSLG
jgi:hypothetical protein